MKKTIFSILVAVLVLGLAQVALGALSGGFVIEIDVDDDQVKPGESFSVEVDVTNNISIDMEDVEVEVVVKDIDDEGSDDLDDDDNIDDLDSKGSSGDDDSIEFDFDVPYAVDEGDYDIIITVTGEAENGTKYETVVNATVEVEKDKHELIMKQPSVDFETLKCSRTTEMSVTLWNIGRKDEDVDLSVYNTELGINQRQSFELEKGDDEDDIKSRRRFVLDLTDAEPKSYIFFTKAGYDSGDEQETESFILKVEDCPAKTETITVEEITPEEEVIVQPTTTVTTAAVTTSQELVPAVVEEETFTGKYGTALLLGLAYLVVIIVGILLVVNMLKKKGE